MKYFMRPYRSLGFLVVLGIAAGAAMMTPAAMAQGRQMVQFLQEPTPLLLHSGSQGYLGVDVAMWTRRRRRR